MYACAKSSHFARYLLPTRVLTSSASLRQPRASSFSTSAAKMTIDLFSVATPNGQKIGIALEELGLPYTPHTIDIRKGDQHSPDFLKINPNGKIPALVDSDGPGGEAITVFESGAILLYLADKTGKLLPKDPAAKYETLAWVFWQVGGVGPMMGQYNHFNIYAPQKIPYAIERYAKESSRLLKVLDTRLEGRQYIMGDEYTIADIASYPWVAYFASNETAAAAVGMEDFANVKAWVARIAERPATARGVAVTPFA